MNTAMETPAVVAELASKFRLPIQDVAKTFSDELRRLEEDARIRSYIAVIAARHTRAILRSRAARAGESQ